VTACDTFAAVVERIAGVEGWLTLDQARRLHDAARELPAASTVAEIGSFRGRSTIVLACSAPADAVVLAVDPHAGGDRGPREITPETALGEQDFAVFSANLAAAGLLRRVRHMRKRSEAALGDAPHTIDLLFVDGAHRLGPARADIVGWGGRVSADGVMFVHDAFSSVGVTAALLTTCLNSRRWRYAGRTGSLAEYRRADLTRPQRVASAVRQAAQLPWFARNLAIKALIVARLGRLTPLLGHRSGAWPY